MRSHYELARHVATYTPLLIRLPIQRDYPKGLTRPVTTYLLRQATVSRGHTFSSIRLPIQRDYPRGLTWPVTTTPPPSDSLARQYFPPIKTRCENCTYRQHVAASAALRPFVKRLFRHLHNQAPLQAPLPNDHLRLVRRLRYVRLIRPLLRLYTTATSTQ
jgi:hypothetical protein